MSYTGVEVALRVTLRSALHVGTGFGLGALLDDRIVQGPHPEGVDRDVPYLPGSSLKGRLRHHARLLTGVLGWPAADREAAESRLFGFAESPGPLVFSDAHLEERRAQGIARLGSEWGPAEGRGERSFVSLSRRRRVALEQRLFRIEIVDDELVFHARVHGHLPTATAHRDLALLMAAARDVGHLGGHKGRGLGRCEVSIDAIRLDLAGGPETPDWATLLEDL
jgi:CRISPR/Cas system CSM-associated protein Csm3 (group 7 of RAMP superfamily)